MFVGSLSRVKVSGECSMCLEDMNVLTEVVITRCGHAFHETCMTNSFNITDVTKTNCPYCRQVPIPMIRAKERPDKEETNPDVEPAMLRALRNADLDYIKEALSAEPSLIEKQYENKADNAHYPIITLAAAFGHQEIVAFLVDKLSKESLDKYSTNGFNALSAACLFGHTQIAISLIKAGARVNSAPSPSMEIDTPLYMAAQRGNTEIVAALVEAGANPNLAISGDRTPLHIAALNDHIDVVKILVTNGAHVNHQGADGVTPLFCAALEGNKEICQYLLAANADPTLHCKEGFFEKPINAATAAREYGFTQLADYIENFPR